MLPALLGVAAMVGLAAPAYGNPDDGFDDAGFLATVRDAGLNYTSSDQAIAFAKGVCGSMGSGKSGPELIHDLQNDQSRIDHGPRGPVRGDLSEVLLSATRQTVLVRYRQCSQLVGQPSDCATRSRG